MSSAVVSVQSYPVCIGQKLPCAITFKDDNAQNLDPTTIKFKFKRLPQGTVTEYVYGVNAELVRDAAGKYHVNLVPNVSGIWAFRFEGTGAVIATAEKEFIVRESYFAP